MSDTVFRFGGTVDNYIGDEVMATFGALKKRADAAERLFACAMIARERALERKARAVGRRARRLGIGIHYGAAALGNVGGERCLEFTVIGDTVAMWPAVSNA